MNAFPVQSYAPYPHHLPCIAHAVQTGGISPLGKREAASDIFFGKTDLQKDDTNNKTNKRRLWAPVALALTALAAFFTVHSSRTEKERDEKRLEGRVPDEGSPLDSPRENAA